MSETAKTPWEELPEEVRKAIMRLEGKRIYREQLEKMRGEEDKFNWFEKNYRRENEQK